MKKRGMSLLLAVVMAFTLLPAASAFAAAEGAAKASGDCVFSVSQTEAKAGGTVTVEVRVKNNPGILGATLKLTWDDRLTLTRKAQCGAAFEALDLTAPKKLSSPYNLVWYAQDLEPEDIKDGVIATLEFTVSPQAKAGEQLAVGVSFQYGDIVDGNKQYLSPRTEDGYVSVTEGEASGGCAICVSQTSAMPGDTVLVNVTVKNNPGILGATLKLTWDDGLTLTKKAQCGAAFEALDLTAQKKLSSPYNLVWYAQDLAPEDIKDGVIATLEFAVSPQAKAGEQLAVGVSYDPEDLIDRQRGTVGCRVLDGGVFVSDKSVAASAVEKDGTVTVSISSGTAIPGAAVYLAEYSAQGRLLGCAVRTADLLAGENTVVFKTAEAGAIHKVFITDGAHKPLCAAVVAEQ